MILYIGDRIDEQFVSEIAKNITEELRMITDVHTMQGIITTIQAVPNRLVIINAISIQEYPEELVKQLKYIQSKFQHNLIIIARGQDSSDPFIQSLYFAGIKNVIVSTWIPTVVSQCLKYITGMYQETNLLYNVTDKITNSIVNNPPQKKGKPESEEAGSLAYCEQSIPEENQTTKLNLSEVFQNDPDILLQLSEEEQMVPADQPVTEKLPLEPEGEVSTGTVKLSNEELYKSGADLYVQVKEYEEEPEQSTILYHQDLGEQQLCNQQTNNQWLNNQQEFEQDLYNQQLSYKEEALYNEKQQFNYGIGTPPDYGNQLPKNKKRHLKKKKSKKSLIITLPLCVILLVSILVPVVFTMMQKQDEEKKNSQEFLAYATSSATKDVSPSKTPEIEVVTGAMEEDAVVSSDMVTQTPQPSQQPVMTLTPIKNDAATAAPQQTVITTSKPSNTLSSTPKVTPTPRVTQTPKATPKPTARPTLKPTENPTPKQTVSIVKIKKLVVPGSIRMIKGTSTEVDLSYSPSNATETIKWSSSNTSIATVKNGVIKAKKVGTITITATTSSGIKKTIQVVIGDE